MPSVLSVNSITKSFSSAGQTVKALDSIDLSIEKGEVFGLLGPNGAGKTTLIAILCGFLIPDKGKATMFGRDCTHESERIQKRMNLVSGFGGVSEFFTAKELLHFFCMLYNLDNADTRVARVLKLTNLEAYKDRVAADFSSGLSRRFLISKSLLNDPEVLLLDEPTVGLDVDAASNMRSMIKDMKKQGSTILLTTHNMKEAEELCDRVALIKQGRIIACGTFSDLKEKFFPLKVIEITCSYPSKIEKLLSKRKSVVKLKKSKNEIKIFLKAGSEVDDILRLITSAGAKVKTINTIEPELEDLYTKVMRNE